MQLLYFPSVFEEETVDMAVTDARVQKIEENVNKLDDKADKLVGLPGQIRALWGTLALLVAVFIAGVVLFATLLLPEVIHQGQDIAGIKADLAGVKQGVADIKQTMLTQRLTQAASDPKNPQSIKEVANILSSAKQQQLYIDPNVIKEAGNKFISTATTPAVNQQVVRQFIDYRSFLNINLAPSPRNLQPFHAEATFSWLIRVDHPPGTISWSMKPGPVNPENSAQLRPLNGSNLISENAELLVVEGKNVILLLDDLYARNVVFKNLCIEYKGGPVVLKNVYFVNCVFDFGPGNKTEELGKAILASTAVTFKSVTS